MNKFIAIIMFAFSGLSYAGGAYTDYANVISVEPNMRTVNRPERNCWTEQITVQQPQSYSNASPMLGAIVGGAIGNSIGKGDGRRAATAAGVAIGAIAGDKYREGGVTYRDVQRCDVTYSQEQVVSGYNVVYEYGGKQFTTVMQTQPSSTIPVTVRVSP